MESINYVAKTVVIKTISVACLLLSVSFINNTIYVYFHISLFEFLIFMLHNHL